MDFTRPTFINGIFIKIPSLYFWHNFVYGFPYMEEKCIFHKKLLYFSVNFFTWIGTRISLEYGE